MSAQDDRTIIVEDLDDLARKQKLSPSGGSGGTFVTGLGSDDEPVTGLAEALNRRVFTWVSPENKDVVVRFRRAPGGTREMIYRLLGPQQSANQQLVRRYAALASIISIGDPEAPGGKIKQPTTDNGFRVLQARVGFVGPDDADWFDEIVDVFVFAYECALYPEQLEIAAELEGSGLSDADKRAIIAATGLDLPKESPAQPS